jgi:enoyl-CoA hydratase/carnithine racemase
MPDEYIKAERQGKAGIIRLNRPEKLNAMTTDMLYRFTALMCEMEADPEVRAIVICGAGKSFCAGRDLKEISGFHGLDGDRARAGMSPLTGLFGAFQGSSKVTMAVVHGYAMGFGCAVAAAADLTVAEEGAVLAMAEARRGLGTFGPLPALMRALPHKILLEMVLTGDGLDAQRAYEVGLVNRMAEAGNGLKVALGWLEDFLDNDTGYVRDTKSALRIARNLTDRDAMDYLLDKSSLHHTAGSGKHGIDQFVER